MFDLKIPQIIAHMDSAIIETIYGVENTELAVGSKILDLSVDLSRAFSQNCPPISYYRVVLRERLWLRRLFVAVGSGCEPDMPIGIFSTLPDEPLDSGARRGARLMTAGIVFHAGMWSGREG